MVAGLSADRDRTRAGICRWGTDPVVSVGQRPGSSLLAETGIEFFSFFFEFEFGLDRTSVTPNDSVRPRSHMRSCFCVPSVHSSE